MVRARNDVAQIAAALANFQRDVGPLVFDGTRLSSGQDASALRPVEVLASGGAMPDVATSVPEDPSSGRAWFAPPGSATGSPMQLWTADSDTDRLDEHLLSNGRNYPVGTSGPGTGWNGPYLSTEVTGDPWGHAFLVNTGFLRGLPPRQGRCRSCAVFVLSAGPNGIIETPFEQLITSARAFGDDIVIRLQ